MAPVKSIIFYGTFKVLHKNSVSIVKIKSDNYYIFKDSIIEEQEKLNKYTNLSEIENVIKNHKKRENLDKEYFIEELPSTLGTLDTRDNETWYVFEYESKIMKTFFNTNATNTITTFIKVICDSTSDTSDSSDNFDNSDTSDSRYK